MLVIITQVFSDELPRFSDRGELVGKLVELIRRRRCATVRTDGFRRRTCRLCREGCSTWRNWPALWKRTWT